MWWLVLVLQVYESNAPMMGEISLGSLEDPPPAKPVSVSLITHKSPHNGPGQPASIRCADTQSDTDRRGPMLTWMVDAEYKLGLMRVGARLYVDADAEFVSIPSKLAGVTYIETAEADASSDATSTSFLRFSVETASDLMVIVDDDGGDRVPMWLASGWERTQMHVQTTAGMLRVWQSKEPLVGEVSSHTHMLAAFFTLISIATLMMVGES